MSDKFIPASPLAGSLSPASLPNPFSALPPPLILRMKMRLQYLNDYGNQPGGPELRLRLIFLSRTKKRDAFGDSRYNLGFLLVGFFPSEIAVLRSLFLLLTRHRM